MTMKWATGGNWVAMEPCDKTANALEFTTERKEMKRIQGSFHIHAAILCEWAFKNRKSF